MSSLNHVNLLVCSHGTVGVVILQRRRSMPGSSPSYLLAACHAPNFCAVSYGYKAAPCRFGTCAPIHFFNHLPGVGVEVTVRLVPARNGSKGVGVEATVRLVPARN